MINDTTLAQLIRAAENLSERDSDSQSSRSPQANIPQMLAQPAIQYLLEPYANGHWELRCQWNSIGPLAKELLEQVKCLEGIDERAAILPASTARKMTDECRTLLLRVTSRISAVHALFSEICAIDAGHEKPRRSTLDDWLDKVDLGKIRTKFASALKIYSEQIYQQGFRHSVSPSRPLRMKGGLVYCLEAPHKSGNVHIVAPTKDDLAALANFYREAGIIPTSTVQRIFAPDEALFKPYFAMLSGVFLHVIQDEQVLRPFSQALDYYEAEDYQHCISTLGLVAEGYLQRIYSTLLREESVSGLTLGQILDLINRRVIETLNRPKSTALKSPDPVYALINAIDGGATTQSLQPILRELVQLILDGRSTLGKRIDEIVKPPPKTSPFPARLQGSLTELLRWRNAAAHNTRIPLGAHEADRTLFCLVQLVTWWQGQLSTLDWSLSKLQIIETLTQA